MRAVYNQKALTITVDGVTIQDYMDGASCIITLDGGEVQKTQGTDGPGVNLATNQGATIQFTLRETSRSIKFLNDLRLRQESGLAGVTAIVRTGANILMTMPESYISRPGQLSTGDKTQGGMQFTLVSANGHFSNTDIVETILDTATGALTSVLG